MSAAATEFANHIPGTRVKSGRSLGALGSLASTIRAAKRQPIEPERQPITTGAAGAPFTSGENR